jgi:hypothetical protein
MTIDSKPVIYEYLKFHCVYNFFIEFNFRNSMTSQEVVDFVREKMKEEENKKQLSSICALGHMVVGFTSHFSISIHGEVTVYLI